MYVYHAGAPVGEPLKRPLHSHDTERALLGAVMLDPHSLPLVRDLVSARDFDRPQHSLLWVLLLRIAADRTPDIVAVMDALGERGEDYGGYAYVSAIPSACASIDSAESYARRVRELASCRRAAYAAAKLIERLGEGVALDEASGTLLSTLSGATTAGGSTWRDTEAVTEAVAEDILRRDPHVLRGITTGLATLDARLWGLRPSTLYVLAGRPGMGKSAVAGCLARNAKVRVGVVSIEMTAEAWIERWACAASGVDSERLTRGAITDEERVRVMDALDNIHGLPVSFADTGGQTLAHITAAARWLVRERGAALLIIDHLQIITPEDARMSEVQALTQITGAIRNLAKELQIPIVLCAQLNRECERRAENRPMLADLRGSGSIEQDADVILFLYREEYYKPDDPKCKGILEVDIAKFRGGRTGKVKLAVDMARMRITDLERRDEPPRSSGYVSGRHWSDDEGGDR